MKLQKERHAEQLEELLFSRADQYESVQLHPAIPDGVDAELGEMVVLARHLQITPSLMADPAFAERLERKVLAHSVRHTQAKAARRNGHWLFGWAPQMWVGFVAILLCLFAGTGTVLAMANGAENPDNPLYGVKVWEQHVQLSLASSPQDQAEVSLQIIRDRLKTATSMADASHADDYQQAIQDADQRIAAVSKVINALPAGSDRERLSSELTALKTDARQTLYSLLPRLPLTAQLATTTVLGHLGAPVPSIQRATVVVASLPTEQATITITGSNLTSSTRLVINNRLVAGNCTLQQNTCVFIIPWHDQNPPDAIAVLNEDDTVAQTTAITFTNPNGENGDSGNSKNGGNNGGGDTNPTGKGTNGHGHSNPDDGAKPIATPGPIPTSTPVSHH